MIGKKTKQLRLKRGLSLSELARRAELSKSLISQIERGDANPTIETVRAIALALEVPVFTLFLDEDSSSSALVRKHERMTLRVPDSQAVRELLTPNGNGAMAVIVSRIPPRARSSPSFVSHDGEEWAFVLRGSLVAHLQDETYLLEAGDFFRFDPRLPHFFANDGDVEVEFVCTIAPARFPPHS